MPYRRLPNTDTARLKAMETALMKSEDKPPYLLPFSASNFQELRYFMPEFKHALILQKETLERQTQKHKSYSDSFRKARLYISHFIQVLNFAILRGELKSDIRKYYSLEEYDKKLPQLSTENDIIKWGKNLIDGEQSRMAMGQSPITNPTIARVKVHYEDFLNVQKNQKHLQDAHQRAIQKTNTLREKADTLILNIWNEVEEHFKDLPSDEKRKNATEYGIKYVFRKNEKKDN